MLTLQVISWSTSHGSQLIQLCRPEWAHHRCKVSQRKSTREIHSRWDRTRENYAVMRMSDSEADCRHENEWAAKAACERTCHRASVNLRKKFTLREIKQERIMRWCESPTKKLAADRALLVLSREHRTFSLALRGNSLSDNSRSRAAAWNYGKDRCTRRLWTLASDMKAKEKALLVLCFFSLALIHRPLPHGSTEERNGRVARGTKSHFMCFSTANILGITQLI